MMYDFFCSSNFLLTTISLVKVLKGIDHIFDKQEEPLWNARRKKISKIATVPMNHVLEREYAASVSVIT